VTEGERFTAWARFANRAMGQQGSRPTSLVDPIPVTSRAQLGMQDAVTARGTIVNPTAFVLDNNAPEGLRFVPGRRGVGIEPPSAQQARAQTIAERAGGYARMEADAVRAGDFVGQQYARSRILQLQIANARQVGNQRLASRLEAQRNAIVVNTFGGNEPTPSDVQTEAPEPRATRPNITQVRTGQDPASTTEDLLTRRALGEGGGGGGGGGRSTTVTAVGPDDLSGGARSRGSFGGAIGTAVDIATAGGALYSLAASLATVPLVEQQEANDRPSNESLDALREALSPQATTPVPAPVPVPADAPPPPRAKLTPKQRHEREREARLDDHLRTVLEKNR
jgi:hypothetical protein